MTGQGPGPLNGRLGVCSGLEVLDGRFFEPEAGGTHFGCNAPDPALKRSSPMLMGGVVADLPDALCSDHCGIGPPGDSLPANGAGAGIRHRSCRQPMAFREGCLIAGLGHGIDRGRE